MNDIVDIDINGCSAIKKKQSTFSLVFTATSELLFSPTETGAPFRNTCLLNL